MTKKMKLRSLMTIRLTMERIFIRNKKTYLR